MPSAMARNADVRKVKDYERRRPERTLLYQLIEEHYPRFLELLATQGRSLPAHVQREFDDFLKCGILEHGFLRVRCQDCRTERLVAFSCKRRGFCPSCGARRMVESAALLVDEVLPHLPMRQWVLSFPFQLRFLFASRPEIMSRVLGLVYRAIETHLIQQAGCTRATAKTGSVTLIQRFGSALNLNIHFHMLFLDGEYLIDRETPVFRHLPAPRPQALEQLIHTISQRVGAYLEREGLLVRDIENSYLQLEAPEESAIDDLLGHSVTYRIAVGPQAGRKAFTLQTIPAREEDRDNSQLAKTAGFSLHAGVAARAHQRRKLERLCRYVARPAVATDRLALTPQGNVRYDVKGFTNVAGAGMRRSDHAENAVSRRHHPHHPRAAGLHRPPGRPGAETARESHPLPRGLRPQQHTATPRDPGRPGQAKAHRGQDPGPAPHRDDLGAAPQTGV